MVDLAKTLTDMSQKGALDTKDITSEVIDVELRDGVMGEPDLLLLFGERVILDGYPPWQIRLTEILYATHNFLLASRFANSSITATSPTTLKA